VKQPADAECELTAGNPPSSRWRSDCRTRC